jgi:hypothetical protein
MLAMTTQRSHMVTNLASRLGDSLEAHYLQWQHSSCLMSRQRPLGFLVSVIAIGDHRVGLNL